MGYSDMTHEVLFLAYISTNGASISFDELFETPREVANTVVNIKLASLSKWFVLTETT